MISVCLWLAAIALAACFDRIIAVHVRDVGLEQWMKAHRPLVAVLKLPGLFWTLLIVAAAAWLTHELRWKAAAFVLLVGGLSGSNELLKWLVGRYRPFKLDQSIAQPFVLTPCVGGLEGMFTVPNLCFPSGHTSLAFAAAAGVAMLWPRAKWRWIAFAIAATVAVERVAENAHWLSDTVAAAALGVGCAHLVAWISTCVLPSPAAQGASAN